jgi:ribosomal protein L40E
MEASGEPQNPVNVPQQAPQPQQPAGPPAGAYGRQSGGILFVIKCIWLFVLGTILAIIGLLCLVYRPDMGQMNPFIIMLMGLFFTAAGSIYGKRKMSGQAAVADYVVDPAQMLQVRPADAIPQQAPQQPQYQPFNPVIYQQRPAEAPKAAQPAAPAMPVEAKPAEIRKIFVCPKCGAENEMGDTFCYKCGVKFVKPKKRAAKKPAKTTKAKATSKAPVKAAAKAKRQAPSVQKKKIPKEEI